MISALAGFGATLKDKKQQPIRDYWATTLNYEIISRRTKSEVTDDARAALAALDAAYNGALARAALSKETLETFRAKIDRLKETEGGARFLPTQERDYIRVLTSISVKQAESQARKLMASADKKLAAVGQEELDLIELGRTPLELKAPTIDGKGFDAAALRGKVVYFLFWSASNEASVKELADLKDDYKRLQKAGVEIVTVCQDTDRAVVEKLAKDKGYAWPIVFDGQGGKGELSDKLNVRSVPTGALFNQQGTLVRVGVKGSQLTSEVTKLGIKTK